MADKVNFELVSPERLLMSVQADMVVVPGSDGDFGVMAGHAPVISTIRPGLISVYKDGLASTPDRLFVRGGFVEVSAQSLTVLAEEAVAVADLDLARLDQELANLQEDIRDAKSDEARMAAQDQYERIRQVRDAAAA